MEMQTTSDNLNAKRLLRLPEVKLLSGLGTTSVYEMIKRGVLARPVKFGRLSLWRAQDVSDFLDRLAQGSEGGSDGNDR